MAQQQRKGQTTQSGSGLRAFYIALGVIALAGVGWIAYSMVGREAGPTMTAASIEGLEDPQALIAAARGVDLGEPDAPVRVLVFSDFTCPACRNFSLGVEPSMKSELIETGKVRFTYHDYPLDLQAAGPQGHRWGFIAARAARCASDQNRFWEFHDVLFARQQEWAYDRSPVARFVEYAGAIGIDTGAFEQCLNSDAHTEVVTANRLLGDNLGVQGTPTVYVAGRLLPQWNSYEALKAAVESALGGQ